MKAGSKIRAENKGFLKARFLVVIAVSGSE